MSFNRIFIPSQKCQILLWVKWSWERKIEVKVCLNDVKFSLYFERWSFNWQPTKLPSVLHWHPCSTERTDRHRYRAESEHQRTDRQYQSFRDETEGTTEVYPGRDEQEKWYLTKTFTLLSMILKVKLQCNTLHIILCKMCYLSI